MLYPTLRALLFQLDPETAHDWTLLLLRQTFDSPLGKPGGLLLDSSASRAAAGYGPRFSQPGRTGGRSRQER
ncbi:MAG: hypothetical protein MZV65_32425 [Chromatiales bacterium]|nr:hypothetical protein [Chromatiales bacterium]